ncbi:MAG: M13 family metallopeptidase [Bryobacteraceae bacterium]|nr:M13 family metallopeptidase [Bryobacteraceae bacterium]
MKLIAFVFLCAALFAADSDLDSTCKPCEDFFKYANQKWIEANPIPGAFGRWSRFNKLAEDNRERLKTILDDVSARPGRKGSDQEKVGNLYASCMDTAAIEKLGLAPVKPYFERIAAVADKAALGKLLTDMFILGVQAPVGVGATPDLKNASQIIAGLDGGGLTLPDRDFYFREDDRSKKIRDEYQKHIVRMHVLLGDSEAQAQETAKTILAFETRLAAPRLTNVERRDPYKRYNKMDFASAAKLAPSFDLAYLFDSARVPKTVPVNVGEPKFWEAFEKELAGTALPVWKSYLRWRLIKAAAPSLPEAFEKEAFEFDGKVLQGLKEQLPRWQRCTQAADGLMGEALGQSFVARYFPPVARKRMDELVRNLRLTLRDELSNADWLSDETRKQAVAKLDKIQPKVGYPEKWRDYASVNIGRNTYIDNLRALRKFNLARQVDKIGKPVDKTEWMMTPPTVNAYYNSVWNEIVFPAGILQPPFFDASADDAFNYGGIGAVIGHEIGHGFDDQGSKFDAEGNLRNWWTDEDRKKFEARAACIVEQFNSFDVQPNARHIGKLVTGEALGDLGGLTLAYKAYKRSLNGKEAPVIDGLTGDQRFFIGFARIWAGHSRPEAERLQLQVDPHPVIKSRVNETLKNMPEFHQAFGCQAGQPMVRPEAQRCKLW